MDEVDKKILAEYPIRQKRSKLTPHRDLIWKLHERHYTVREIADILSEKHNLNVNPSTVHRFIAKLEQERSKPRKNRPQVTKPRKQETNSAMPTETGVIPSKSNLSSNDDIRKKIEELKQRKAEPEHTKELFKFNPEEPLHLVKD